VRHGRKNEGNAAFYIDIATLLRTKHPITDKQNLIWIPTLLISVTQVYKAFSSPRSSMRYPRGVASIIDQLLVLVTRLSNEDLVALVR
jgi:hypothetical protein